MKPTEAKEWIDKLVSTGMKRDAATVLVNEAAALPKEVALCALGMTYGARAAAIPVEPEREPVEIPRRVVMVERSAIGLYSVGDTGTVIGPLEDDDKKPALIQFDADGRSIKVPWGEFYFLNLTKTEQARLLLEKLSAKCYPFFTGDNSPENCWLNQDGSIGSALMIEEAFPYFVPIFPSYSSATAARETIIRAGLAWWEEGE